MIYRLLNCLCDDLCIEALLTVKLLQYNLVRIIVMSIYNDTVTPSMKTNFTVLFYDMLYTPVHPNIVVHPFKNFGTP